MINIILCFIGDGSSIHMIKWINYFASKGYEVHLISFKLSNGYHSSVKFHNLFFASNKHYKFLTYIRGILRRLLWLVHTVILLNKIKPDIVNAHYITKFGDLAAFSGFRPFILNPWGSDILIEPKKNKIRKIVTKFCLNRADLIIVDSDLIKREISHYRIKEEKIIKIFNGIDIEKFSRKDHDPELKKLLLIDDTSPVIISTRNLRPIYNVEMLIKAIPLVLQKRENAIFIIIGDGELMEQLKDLASATGIANAVKFVGGINSDKIPDFLSISDIYVSTSLSDSTSLSLQEAMACEVAPIITDIPANREWISDGKNGFLVSINDSMDLCNKIITLIDNTEIRQQFGKINRQMITKNANYQIEMEKVENIYKQFLSD